MSISMDHLHHSLRLLAFDTKQDLLDPWFRCVPVALKEPEWMDNESTRIAMVLFRDFD